MYEVRSYNSDPQQCVTSSELIGITADELCLESDDKEEVRMLANQSAKYGYWVEVYCDGELMAGPIDPDKKQKSIIF